jgi:hypothetical protein
MRLPWYNLLSPYLNEKTRRIWASIEARSLGWGGVSQVARATGLSRTTIHAGMRLLSELDEVKTEEEITRIRISGGGRKLLEEQDAMLLGDLESLIEPMTLGDPESPLKWTNKSVVKLANALNLGGHRISPKSVYNLLESLGYSLQSNRKARDGSSHRDRDEQFLHISSQVKHFQSHSQPVISVDTKKKELIGDLKNPGTEWCPSEQPVEVRMHDFVDPQLGKAIDCGGSNSYRSRLWKLKLQNFADEINQTIHVCHFPPGTSKWNKIEHRLFCHITQNWRGRPYYHPTRIRSRSLVR